MERRDIQPQDSTPFDILVCTYPLELQVSSKAYRANIARRASSLQQGMVYRPASTTDPASLDDLQFHRVRRREGEDADRVF